jgi:hypothetical protein
MPPSGTKREAASPHCPKQPGQWRRGIADKRGGRYLTLPSGFRNDNADKLCRAADALPTTIGTELGVCPKQSERRSTPSAAAPILSVVSGESIVDRHGLGKFIRLPLGRSRPLDSAAYCAAAETPRRVFPAASTEPPARRTACTVESHVLVPLPSRPDPQRPDQGVAL